MYIKYNMLHMEKCSGLPLRLNEGKKGIFYLTTHSIHFVYGYYGVGHMVKDQILVFKVYIYLRMCVLLLQEF